jgi:hypothetical protein
MALCIDIWVCLFSSIDPIIPAVFSDSGNLLPLDKTSLKLGMISNGPLYLL